MRQSDRARGAHGRDIALLVRGGMTRDSRADLGWGMTEGDREKLLFLRSPDAHIGPPSSRGNS